MKHSVLDKGFVELMSNTPDGDLLVVNAARVSFDKEHEMFQQGSDTKLINYLAKHKHLLPFRHAHASIRIHVPLFVLRQISKHQVGFSWSEISRRYITTEPEFHRPDVWRKAADDVKQGSVGIVSKDINITADLITQQVTKAAILAYNKLLDMGICAEQAREHLPQSMYTTTVTTGSLLGWHHMFTQRTDGHTQRETQYYALAIGKIMRELFPTSWGALCKHS